MNEAVVKNEFKKLDQFIASIPNEVLKNSAPLLGCSVADDVFLKYVLELYEPKLKEVDWQIPELHRDWLELLDIDDRKTALFAPVGFAKSTILKVHDLKKLFTTDPYILYVSSSFTKTTAQVGGIFKILKDPALQFVFGYSVVSSNTTEIIIKFEKEPFERKLEAVSAGADISGINFNGQRPTLITIDDVEELDQARSAYRTNKLQDWLLTTLISRLPSLTEGKVRLIGTVFSTNSLAYRIKHNLASEDGSKPFSDWKVKTYTALQSNKSIWEDKHSTEALLKERQKNPVVFARNYENEPLEERGGLIDRSQFRYYTVSDYDFAEIYTHFDLASSLKERADYFAGITVGKSKDGKFYVLDIIRSDKPEDYNDPEIQAQLVINNWMKFSIWGLKKITFESNQYQSTLKNWTDKTARSQGIYPNFVGVRVDKDKYTRFVPFIPHFTSNSVYLPSNHEKLHYFEQELVSFPEGAHDDLVDAFSGCMANFETPKKGVAKNSFFVKK